MTALDTVQLLRSLRSKTGPPLTVDSADALTADEAIPGEFGTITRADDGTIR